MLSERALNYLETFSWCFSSSLYRFSGTFVTAFRERIEDLVLPFVTSLNTCLSSFRKMQQMIITISRHAFASVFSCDFFFVCVSSYTNQSGMNFIYAREFFEFVHFRCAQYIHFLFMAFQQTEKYTQNVFDVYLRALNTLLLCVLFSPAFVSFFLFCFFLSFHCFIKCAHANQMIR